MDFKIKNLPKSEIEIKVTLDKKEMEEYLKKAAEEISKDVKVKGFRSGNVPLHVLEQYVDKKFIQSHGQELAVKMSYAKIVMQENIQVIARPKIEIDKKADQEEFSYTATAAVMPEVTLKDYKSIKIAKEKIKVEKKEVEQVLEDIQKHHIQYKKVDRALKKGDKTEVDFEGFDEKGKAVENTKSKNHPVIIGEQSLIPGFEEELIGLKVNDEKEFKITFPKDYHKEDFQNKKMKFKVKVHSVEEAVKPEFNEEFIEKVTGKKQKPDKFKEEVEKNVLARKEQEAKRKRENDYIEALVKKTTVEVPEALVDDEVEYMIEEMKKDITQRGIEFEKFLEAKKMDLDKLKKSNRPEAERRIKIRLALQTLIKEEKIEVTDKDVQKELEKIKSMYPPNEHQKIDQDFEKGTLKTTIKSRLILEKTFSKMLKE